VRDVMQKFVGVRIIQANGLDLKQFQFDWDLTFAVFFMNADKTIYGRYGTRSDHAAAERDISLEGFGKAMTAALALHANYPADKEALAGKLGPAPRFGTPEQYAPLKKFQGKFDVLQDGHNCMHCHQVGNAEKRLYRDAGKPLPDDVLFPYPLPDVLGLKLDPKEKATVLRVTPGSAAAKAGFRRGDELLALDKQPLLSIADVQWVLHQAQDESVLAAEVRRAGKTVPLSLELGKGWRRRGDISWRESTWDLRRMVTGGLVLEEPSAEGRHKLALANDALGLRVKYVGQYGAHAAGRDAGFRVGDVLVAVDGVSKRMSESELIAHLLESTKPRQRVAVKLRRGSEELELSLPMQ
jgi:serine protease Do